MAKEIINKGIKGKLEEIYGMETTLHYPEKYAGTADLVGVYQGKEAIIDFKQANKPKKREALESFTKAIEIDPNLTEAYLSLSTMKDTGKDQKWEIQLFSENFLNNKAQLIGLHVEENCPVINTPLRQLTDLFSTLRVIVVGVRRKGILFAPSAGDQLFCSDDVYLMCHSSDVSRTMDVFGKSQGEQNRVILIGGGNV